MDCTNAYLYNCIFSTLNGTAARLFSGTADFKNCAVLAGSGTGFLQSGGTIAPTNCISTDTTADDFGGSGNQANVTEASMAFTDATNTDFHIATGSTLKDQGTDLSGDADYAFSDDIDGQTRTGTWDVGADEGASAAAPSTATFQTTTGRPFNMGRM
jgi:hypothetical protein